MIVHDKITIVHHKISIFHASNEKKHPHLFFMVEIQTEAPL